MIHTPTKAGYSNLQYDFGSILKAIEGMFGQGTLGFADQRATNDLHDFFNFKQPPTGYKRFLRRCPQASSSTPSRPTWIPGQRLGSA